MLSIAMIHMILMIHSPLRPKSLVPGAVASYKYHMQTEINLRYVRSGSSGDEQGVCLRKPQAERRKKCAHGVNTLTNQTHNRLSVQ